MSHNMNNTLLDTKSIKPTDFNYRRKIAWLGSDRKFPLSEEVYASLPFYFLEGEVHSNIQKFIQRTKELGYDTLLFGERFEPQVLVSECPSIVFELFAKANLDIILKFTFHKNIYEKLANRDYLLSTENRESLLKILKKVKFPV